MLRVEILDMDIFDPTTGEVRSSTGKNLMSDVAAWFVDHDYDEESFFVLQADFVGDDPYDGLKRALKAEIDDSAWAELNSTISRPFPKPKHGLICVKVINHFGDEVQKVFRVTPPQSWSAKFPTARRFCSDHAAGNGFSSLASVRPVFRPSSRSSTIAGASNERRTTRPR